MKSIRTHAIILSRTNYGEADRVLQLLTPAGKKSAIAKGVRREKSRLASGIELFAICDVVLQQGKGELGTLTSAKLVKFFDRIISDYDRMNFAYTVIKSVSKGSDTINGSDWYDLLAELLEGLNTLSMNLEMIQTWFYIHYSVLMGYELSLQYDVSGQKLLPDQNYSYDINERGLRPNTGGEITADHIKLLRLIATKPLKILNQISGIDKVVDECLIVALHHASV
jgi:DNA repair protein RecO (recombination protein O)